MTRLVPDLDSRARIVDALARYAGAIDEGDCVDAVSVFADDCVTDYGPRSGGPIRGRAAFLERLTRSQSRFRRTHHQLGQTTFDSDDGVVTSITYATASHRRWDDSLYVSQLQYRDRWEESATGWRIGERRVCLTVVVDPDGPGEPGADEVNWLPRSGSKP